jgi:GTPase SAR1 family protein
VCALHSAAWILHRRLVFVKHRMAAVQQRLAPRRRSKGVDDLYTSRAQEAPQKKHWCVRIKIISLGGLATGKSCLIKRFCEERFVSKYISTIGIDYGVKPVTVKGEHVRVNFWDLSGHPDFFEIRNEFYKDSQGGVLVYDVSNRAR